jgi:hypothetical protein
LVALDRIFEEARYSSHTLGETDRHNAQYALSLIINELQNMQEVPDRDGNMEELEN